MNNDIEAKELRSLFWLVVNDGRSGGTPYREAVILAWAIVDSVIGTVPAFHRWCSAAKRCVPEDLLRCLLEEAGCLSREDVDLLFLSRDERWGIQDVSVGGDQ
jgi:hypothetical protein